MRVLAIFAHPDDEVLACGGTLARHVEWGDTVMAAIFTDGVGARFRSEPEAEHEAAATIRSTEFKKAQDVLGCKPIAAMPKFPDQQLSVVQDLADRVAFFVNTINPQVIYTHWPQDLNADHRAVAEAVLVATRPLASRVTRLIGCEVPESTGQAFGAGGYRPNYYVDITKALEKKLAAVRCYASEKRDPPHPRSELMVSAHAAYRGSEAGCMYAEGFHLLREVRR